ncbi:MAG: DUF2892 domain-containing protein [Nevskiaceae bacterium]|nr:MAG: DUF2892 domain-containing protein [Nevskiaceae bacterium]
MQANVGALDRTLRVTVGVVLICAAAVNTIGPWGWLGIVPVLTGLFRFCPAYALFSFRTCPLDPPKA